MHVPCGAAEVPAGQLVVVIDVLIGISVSCNKIGIVVLITSCRYSQFYGGLLLYVSNMTRLGSLIGKD